MAEHGQLRERALVLGGGGLSGIAWETGVLAGLAAGGADVTGADFVLGTSAGATVAAQLGSGLPLGDLFDRQTVPALQSAELTPDIGRVIELMESWEKLPLEYPDPAELRREIGQRALEVETVPEAERRAVIAGRLPRHTWPSRKLAVVAVEAHTGDVRVFDQDSGADLVDRGDGQLRDPRHLAAGHHRREPLYRRGHALRGQRRSGRRLPAGADPGADGRPVPGRAGRRADPGLRRRGPVQVLAPDDESIAAMGINPLDPGVRAPVAQAGYAQGKRAAAEVARLWQLPGR